MNLEICGYILELDPSGTKEIYEKINKGGSEECTCDYCKNYIEAIESIFPKEVEEFFLNAGIDKTKDAEVYEYCEETPGIHHYGGEYYLLAKVLKHPKKPASMGEHFNFAFTEPSPLAQDEFRIKGSVCFTFDTMIPWKLK
ncbi:hypothetical protein [Aliikangiella maris]|uniref:Uncharacterized protein n=2 Tax=Aliikangiella maris TaxID=3162458 RepID=A0ABV3MSF5_9GAMM